MAHQFTIPAYLFLKQEQLAKNGQNENICLCIKVKRIYSLRRGGKGKALRLALEF
jgi:hypothetical protein